jgi:hypothetical protein
MELHDAKNAVNRRHDEHRDTQVSPVIEQQQESFIQPTQRPNGQDYVQQQQSQCPGRPDNQRFYRVLRVKNGRQGRKEAKVHTDENKESPVVTLFLRVPQDGLVIGAHGCRRMV